MGFHCQQSAEKYLKALIQELGQVVPHTHDLGTLLGSLQVHHPQLLILRKQLKTLTRYAVEYRFPGVKATKRKAEAALRHAEKVRSAVRERLGVSE